MFFVGPMRNENVNTLNRIDPQVNLLLGHLFFFSMSFLRFKSSSGGKWFILVFSLVFITLTVLIGLWFFLIPGFASVNVQFKSIVRDKFSSLPMLFLPWLF